MSETAAAGPQYRKKITAALFQPYPEVTEGETKWVGSILGEVREIETDTSLYGEFLRLKGDFVAKNLETGATFMATSCILPDLGADVVRNYLAGVGFPEKVKSAVFSMEIGLAGIKKKNPTDRGYSWTIRPVRVTAGTAVSMIATNTWDTSAKVAHDPETGEIAEPAPQDKARPKGRSAKAA